MCKKSKANAKILKDRTKGLDSRGNVSVNTQAESKWAVNTLSNLDQNTVALLNTDLKRVYDGTVGKDMITVKSSKKFHKGYEKLYGKDGSGTPSAQDLTGLMLESDYDFKEAVDALNRNQKGDNKKLWEHCRKKEEFEDRGRIQGRQRANSFVGPHAGITDHLARTEDTENFFETEVVHAKGMFEGDPKSKTYKRFVEQGAPFIGGVSGTMQGLTMAWEQEKPLASIDDDQEKQQEIAKRETMAGVYMATLLAGGHHSASEMLFSAQSYGLFAGVEDPLKNYPKAMKELGERFVELGLPGDLTPQAGASWRAAITAVDDSLTKLEDAIADAYVNEAFANALKTKFLTDVKTKVSGFFTDALALKLDEVVSLVDDKDKVARQKAIDEAKDLIEAAQEKLDEDVITALDENPFLPLTVRKTVETALSQLSALAR